MATTNMSLIILHFERFISHSDEFEIEYLVHDHLIKVKDGARTIYEDRLFKAGRFTDSNTACVNEMDLAAVIFWCLYDISMVEEVVRA